MTHKKMNLESFIVLVVSATIGSGIFDLPRNMSLVAGLDAQIIAWCITGIGIWFLIETFIFLNNINPNLKAGLYQYGKVGFGNFVGFIDAWGYFICQCLNIVIYDVLIIDTIYDVIPSLFGMRNIGVMITLASIILWTISIFVIYFPNISNAIQKISMVIMLTVIVIFILTICFHFKLELFSLDPMANKENIAVKNVDLGPIKTQISNTMMVTLWLFSGIEGAVVMSNKANNHKIVSRATFIGFLFCLISFFLVSILPLGVFSYGEISSMKSPSMANILSVVWNNIDGKLFIIFGLIVTVISSWISLLQMAAELPYHASKNDHLFPPIFSKLSKSGIPSASIFIETLIIQLLIMIVYFYKNIYELLLYLNGTMIIMPYMVCALYLIKTSIKCPRLVKRAKYSWKKSLFIGIGTFTYMLYMIYSTKIKYIFITVLIYIIGIPLYLYSRRDCNKKIE